MSTILLPFGGWRAKVPSKKAKLRALLSDGNWHGQSELTSKISHRFGAIIFSLHRDREPVHYERRTNRLDDSVVHYRMTKDETRCTACLEAHRRETEVGELRAEVARLKARIVELEGGARLVDLVKQEMPF
jgi:hypothetical protein